MLNRLHITTEYQYGDEDETEEDGAVEALATLCKELQQRDEAWTLFRSPGSYYCRLDPKKASGEFSWLPGIEPPLLQMMWHRLTIMGDLTDPETPMTPVLERPARERIDGWVQYAREKFSDDLPDASHWNVSQLTCRRIVSLRGWTTIATLGRVSLPRYKTIIDQSARKISWQCGVAEFGFTELRRSNEGLITVFEVYLNNPDSVKRVAGHLGLGRTVDDLIWSDVLADIADYYFREKIQRILPLVPVDLELYRRRLGPGKWDAALGFAILMLNHSYSPSVLRKEGYYKSGTTVRRRRRALEGAGLWNKPLTRPLIILPEELLDEYPELDLLLPGIEVSWEMGETAKNGGTLVY